MSRISSVFKSPLKTHFHSLPFTYLQYIYVYLIVLPFLSALILLLMLSSRVYSSCLLFPPPLIPFTALRLVSAPLGLNVRWRVEPSSARRHQNCPKLV